MTTNSSPRLRRHLAAAILMTCSVLIAFELPDFFPFRRFGTDTLQWLAAPIAPTDPDIVVIAIDDASLMAHGNWPFPRDLHAKLLDILGAAQPRIVLFDLIFRQGNALDPKTQALAQSLKNLNKVIIGYDLTQDGTSWLPRLPLPILNKAAMGVGFLQHPFDEDGIIRRAKVISRDRNGKISPSMSLVAASESLKASWHLNNPKFLVLQRSKEDAGFGNLVFPLGMDGDIPIDFAAFGERGFPIYSYTDVLANKVPNQAFHNKAVLIGLTAPILQDRYPTPLSGEGDFSRITPGVVIQAYSYWTLVNGRVLLYATQSQNRLCLSFAILVAALLGCLLPPSRGAPLICLLSIGTLLLTTQLFQQGFVLDWVVPSIGMLIIVAMAIGFHYREAGIRRERVQSLFGSFVPQHLVDRLVENPELLEQEGREEQRTILMADLRGFTKLSSSLGPRDTVAMLNQHFAELAEVIFRHDGIIDKFMGDAVMAVFGELGGSNTEQQALEASQEMLAALHRSNKAHPERPPLVMGIGISTGPVIVGHIGSSQKREYTVIGEAANLAARLEKETKKVEQFILCDANTKNGAPELDFIELGKRNIRGFDEDVEVFAPKVQHKDREDASKTHCTCQ